MEAEKTAIGYESVTIAKIALIGTSPSGKVASIDRITFVGSTLSTKPRSHDLGGVVLIPDLP